MQLKDNSLFCSQEGTGPIIGNAPETRRWLLLEYRGPWGPKVIPYSSLSRGVKDYLQHLTQAIPQMKVLFIKQPARKEIPGLKLYLFDCSNSPKLASIDLTEHDDLLKIEVEKFFSTAPDMFSLSKEELYLICTNGKKDRCCAKFGLPFYSGLCSRFGESVWQCSHFGGHKYAPTFMHFPTGNCYGRLKLTDLQRFSTGVANGDNPAAIFRGRIGIAKVAQAAEFFLQKSLEQPLGIRFNLSAITEKPGNIFEVVLENMNQAYCVQVIRKEGPEEISSCRKAVPGPTWQHELGSIEEISSSLTKTAT